MTAKGRGILWGEGDENILKRIEVMDRRVCEYTKMMLQHIDHISVKLLRYKAVHDKTKKYS